MMRRIVPLTLALVLSAMLPNFARANGESVDLALVLAVDVSGSIDSERFAIQRNGYAAAFSNPSVIDAIASGEHGAIVVTFLEWSGPGHQQQVVGWTRISDAASAAAFGNAIAKADRAFSDWTSISGAIDSGVALLQNSGFQASRRVIDISGDGPNNSGRPVAEARDGALAAGITINGLPIVATEPNLESYYRENVVGGDGSFTIVVQNFDSFATGVLNKLVREIASRPRVRRFAMASDTVGEP